MPRRCRSALLLVGLALTWPAVRPAAAQPAPPAKEKAAQPAPPAKEKAAPAAPAEHAPSGDEQVLKQAGLSPTGPALVEFFRLRVEPDADRGKLQTLVRQLGDKAPEVRERASAELVGRGSAAIPVLRQAANEIDSADVAEHARQLLSLLEGSAGRELSAAAARALGQTRPPGAVEALLAYLPFAEDDRVADEIGKALAAVAVRDGKADPALVKALKDPVPVRRAVAGEVLSRAGAPDERAAVRALLQDSRPMVRLRVALALAQAGDAEAVGVLIAVLGDLPPEQTRQVEDFLIDLAGDWSVRVPPGNDDVARRMRRDVWAAWWRTLDGPVLVEEFRKRTLADADLAKAQEFLHSLADPAAEARDKALTGLLALGPNVAPLVRHAAADPKMSQAAENCLRLLRERGAPTPLPTAAARLLAVKRPTGAPEAMLAYLPVAEDDAMAGEIQSALTTLAIRDGKLDPALTQALDDKVPARRAAAAEAICRGGTADDRQLVRRLLKDADVTVRLRAGLGLAGSGDREAVPVLIALLAEVPPEDGGQVEDYLRQAAGEQAPDVTLGEEAAERQKCRDAWAAWWREKGDKAELPRPDSPFRTLGYTLIVDQYDPVRRSGRVWEVDRAGKTRWSIDGLQAPVDAQVLPGERVLVVEQNLQRVSERDAKGKVLWERSAPNIMAAERLRNGNTFITTRGQMLEVDRSGKEVFIFNRPNGDIMAARRLKDGQYAFVTFGSEYQRVDASGKELKSGHFGAFQFTGNAHGAEILPNDRVLLAQWNINKVTEVDLTGKVLWEATVPWPMSVSRLPNGNTLIASNNTQKVTELDRSGKMVWEYKENNRPFFARRR
jgi:HEAT repeat protein